MHTFLIKSHWLKEIQKILNLPFSFPIFQNLEFKKKLKITHQIINHLNKLISIRLYTNINNFKGTYLKSFIFRSDSHIRVQNLNLKFRGFREPYLGLITRDGIRTSGVGRKISIIRKAKNLCRRKRRGMTNGGKSKGKNSVINPPPWRQMIIVVTKTRT